MKTSVMWMAVLLAHWAIVHAIDEDNNGLQDWKIDWTGKGGDKRKDGGKTVNISDQGFPSLTRGPIFMSYRQRSKKIILNQ